MLDFQIIRRKKVDHTWVRIAFVCLCLVGASSVNAKNYCGPNSSLKNWKNFATLVAVPDYACYNKSGGIAPYATFCAVPILLGYKPVYFGVACKTHDSCYSKKGAKKSDCDNQFGDLLKETCNTTLTGVFANKAKSSCNKTATTYSVAVIAAGCSAYKSAQIKAGNKKPTC
jgi:hypothetical protein